MAFIKIEEEDFENEPQLKKLPSKAESQGRSVFRGIGRGIKGIGKYSPVRGPLTEKGTENILSQLLPTREGMPERFIENITKGITEGAIGGPELALLSGGGEALSQLAKEANAPEWVQHLAQILPMFASKKGLSPKASQKEAVNFLRSKKLTDKEITPLLKTEKQIRKLGKFAHKGERLQKRLRGIHEKLGEGYNVLKEEGKTLELPKNKSKEFENILDKKLDDLAPDLRRLISENVEDLYSNPITQSSLIDFFQGINRKVYKEGPVAAKEVLNIVKDPIQKGLEMINPENAKDFKLLNEYTTKKHQLFKTLKPNQVDNLIDLAETFGVLGSIAIGDLNKLQKVLGIAGMRAFATEMLINPDLQNLSNKMAQALSKNQIGIYQRLSKIFMDKLEKKSPEIYEKINEKIKDKQPQKTQKSTQ